jgi:energy-coupling factor transport system permease protein
MRGKSRAMVLDFYKPGSGLLHRFDPRAKLILLATVTTCFFLPFRLEVLGVYLAALLILVGFCLGAEELGKSLAALAPLLAVICLLTPLFRRGGSAVWSPFGVPYLTSAGILEAARLAARFAGITLAFFASFRTIDMNDLILTMRWFGLPFRASLVFIITLRFIPSLFGVYGNVRDAHALRQSPTRKRRFFERLIPVLTSMIIQAVRGIPTLAMALECRGFGRRNSRTQYMALGNGARLARHLSISALATLLLLAPLAFFR